MTSFQTAYNSGGTGANLAHLTRTEEDEIFQGDDAKGTQWKQNWEKYTEHQSANMVQAVQNAGLGKTVSVPLIKTPDFLFSSYTVTSWPGLIPNVENGVTETSYVNARALFVKKQMNLKIASQTIFTIDGHAMLCYVELMGLLAHIAPLIGFCYTKNQLIEDSRRPSVTFAGWHGWSFQSDPSQAFTIGAIAFHPVTWELITRTPSEMIVNYNGQSSKGLYALPLELGSRTVFGTNSIDIAAATTCVWVGQKERYAVVNGYYEAIFREITKAGEHTIAASPTAHRFEFSLNIKGPVTNMWITIQSQDDLDAGNHTRLCREDGDDYITEMMLITDNTPREDGLPASFYRTAKVLESFKTSIRRHIYVLSFETNSLGRQFTGHQTMTSVQCKFSALYKPHACPLYVRVDATILNGWYTEKGSGGRVWS